VPDRREALARALHEEYLSERLAAGEPVGSTPALVPWSELPEEFRESSRRNGDDLGSALRERGFEVAAIAGQAGATLGEDDVEWVAERVHRRWVEERLATGWRAGASRDDTRRAHPDLVPWTNLPEERREIDRNLVRRFPGVLHRIGLKLDVRPIDEPDG
jgi:hypothetical protein